MTIIEESMIQLLPKPFNPVYAIEFVTKALKAIKSSAYVTSHSHNYGERMIGATQ